MAFLSTDRTWILHFETKDNGDAEAFLDVLNTNPKQLPAANYKLLKRDTNTFLLLLFFFFFFLQI